MDYVSPYLLNSTKGPSSFDHEKETLSPSEVLNEDSLSPSEKLHILDKLEHEALAALTMSDKIPLRFGIKSPARQLEDVIAAKRTLYHAS